MGILKATTYVNLLKFKLSFLKDFHPYSTFKAFMSLILLCSALNVTRLGRPATKINKNEYYE